MRLRSGHVTLEAEFQPPKFSPVGLRAPGAASRWPPAQIFSGSCFEMCVSI